MIKNVALSGNKVGISIKQTPKIKVALVYSDAS